MTAEPDLLPLPSPQVPFIDCDPSMTDIRRLVRWYEQGATEHARANVAHVTAAKDAEIEALRAEVREAREFRDKMANAIGNDQLRRFIEKHGEPVPLTIRMHQAEARAEQLAEEVEALRAKVERLTLEMERLQQQYDERTACMIVHRGSALACSDAVRAAYSDEHHRAERLAEALRDAQKSLRTIANLAGGTEYLMTIGDVRGYANSRANAARVALAQEDRNG